jgi:hypothetical protein
VSNVGYVDTTGKIVDVHAKVWAPAIAWREWIGISPVTTFGGNNDRLTLRYTYSPLVYTRTDAVRGLKMIVHSLKEIDPKMQVVDAIRELREVKA